MITDISNIKINQVAESRITQVDFNNLPFGRVFSDHMLVMDYTNGQWQTPEIVPFDSIKLHPATSAIHYGQSIFEGMKAYRMESGEIAIFRPYDNAKRFNESADRLCMPQIHEEAFVKMIAELVRLDQQWIPTTPDSALYLRPYLFATDEFIGIKPSDNYKFMIFTCPVGQYYAEPLRVKIEEYFTRAVKGGVGRAKTAGNYAASLYPARLAQKEGYHQLIWTDAEEHKYIEESGTMNIVFVIGDKIISPSEDTDTILRGITKRSVLDLARDWGYEVEERKVSVNEVIEAIQTGELKEAFGAGTAATIAHIDIIHHQGTDYKLPEIASREFSNKVYKQLNSIKSGKAEDKFDWIKKI